MAGHQGAKTVTGGYRYRGSQSPQTPDQQRADLSGLLADKQGAIRFRSSRIRDLSASLNLMVAQALRDGAPATALSRITQLSTWTIRRTSLAFDDLQPTGLSPAEHLRLISQLLHELTALEESKAAVEEERRRLLAEASKQRILDDFELASLTGLRPEHIRKMTRGVPPGSRRTVPALRPAVSSP
jgi:transposase